LIVPNLQSKLVAECLAKPHIHKLWERSHLTKESEPFYRLAYSYILSRLQPSTLEPILDAGCGPCFHAIHLAQRGYRIQGVDFSEAVLENARTNLKKARLVERVQIQQGDLTALSFADESFRVVWCWGVLMHIPEIEKAIAELSRITKIGGHVVLSVVNSHSLQAMITMVKTKLGFGQFPQLQHFSCTAPGYEYWTKNEAGIHLTRHNHIRWTIAEFQKHGLRVDTHVAGQFTEHFLKFPPGHLRKMIHGWNNFWFQRIRFPFLAFGNILILEKK
jgi:ubiquinone/menaquinone biosynthesis C-methylase UbiE